MLETINILPGVTLRCFRDARFKQSRLSVQLVRPMRREEAALNALIPAVLLRGCESCPDLRDITLRLDDLYGASVGALVRRIGDYQTTGLYCSFISDEYTLDGESVFTSAVDFVEELLRCPILENGVFRRDYIESEKVNLISAIESQLNDKRSYAAGQLLKAMCQQDSYSIPRLGTAELVAEITPESAFAHYEKILRESRVDLFYVGPAPAQQVSACVAPMFDGLQRDYQPLPEQTAFHPCPAGSTEEKMAVAQGKLGMGFTTPVTVRDEEFGAMQVFNTIFGSGMTCKLFQNVREKLSLCYDIGSVYHGSKGIIAVHAGIDFDKKDLTQQEILRQLKKCQDGEISDEELIAAKQALICSLESTHDSPGAIEGYYASGALSSLKDTPEEYMRRIEEVTREQVVQAAKSVSLHTVYFLKGVD